MKIFRIILLLTVIIIINSCQCDKKKSTSENQSTNQNDDSGFNNDSGFQDVYYRFPSPEEMLNVINEDGLNFNADLIAPIQSVDNFVNSKSQALNMGVYIADMAYITIFKRHKESIKYLQTIYKLSDKLRISAAFDPKLMMRIENNLNNVDTLRAISDEAYTDISNYLEKYDKEKVFAVISIGGYIESLYVALHLIDKFDPNDIIVQRISDQKLVLNNLINYAKAYEDDNNVKEALDMIQPIKECFDELGMKESSTSVKQSKDGKIILSGGNRIVITENQFDKLRSETVKIRTSILTN